MKKQKILFINPPLYYHRGQPHSLDHSTPPLGILYLASYLKKHQTNLTIQILDLSAQNQSLSQTLSHINKIRPFVICLSIMTPQLQAAFTLAKHIKKILPSQPIIIGGPHVSADPHLINRFPDLFDYAITGEAEITLYQTICKLLNHQKITKIQTGQVPANLDDIPIPDRSLINPNIYQPNESIIFSRGCPFHCYYCSRPAIDRKVRYRSVDNLITEIKQTYPHHNGQIDFQDDTFTLNPAKVKAFCQAVIKQKLPISWSCNTRIDMVDPTLLKSMATAGCRQINFGIESANFQLRSQVIHKGTFTNQTIKKTFQICHHLSIKVAAYFMIGHPQETKSDIDATKKMILTYPIDILGLSIPLPFPGSPLYLIAQKRGLISTYLIDAFATQKLGIGYAGIYPEFHPRKIHRSYLYQQLKDINRRFYLKPKIILQTLKANFLSPKKLITNAKDFLSLLLWGVSTRKPYRLKP